MYHTDLNIIESIHHIIIMKIFEHPLLSNLFLIKRDNNNNNNNNIIVSLSSLFTKGKLIKF